MFTINFFMFIILGMRTQPKEISFLLQNFKGEKWENPKHKF